MKPIDRRTALAMLAGLPAAFAAAPAAPAASVPLSYDKDGRPTVPVGLNGKGPFALVADTAAGGTALTPALAQELGLVADTGSQVAVRGASGTSAVQAFNLDSLNVGALEIRPARATSLPNAGISDSRGVLGADTFAKGRVEFDFAAGRLTASGSGAPPAGYTVLKPRFVHRLLPIITASLGGIETPALVDTGARATLVNAHLMQALGYAPGDPRLTVEERPAGATGHVLRSYLGGSASLTYGGLTFPDQKLVFIDTPIFAVLGMGDGPGLILGIDSLRRFDAVAVDYPRAEVQLRPRG